MSKSVYLNDIFKHFLNEFPIVHLSKREEKQDAMNYLTLSVFSNVYEDFVVQYVYSVVSVLGDCWGCIRITDGF